MTAPTIDPTPVHIAAAARYLWTNEWARPDQLPPDGDWTVWLIMSGRGWGKTRTGAEWLAYEAVRNPDTRWAIVAPTGADARDTCVEGVSGVLPILNRYRQVKVWNRSLGELKLHNGSRIKLFSGDEPDRLRGPQHHGAWCDEVSSWRYPDAWDQLQFGLRLGTHPKVLVTTTPKPNQLIRSLAESDQTRITRGSTFDNAANLSEAALTRLRERYEGTRLGRQELHGELLTDIEGALFTTQNLADNRLPTLPPGDLRRVVAIDPAVTAEDDSDMTGIIVASADDSHAYIEADYSQRTSPDGWARTAVAAYHDHDADYIVAEVNNGGDMIPRMIAQYDKNIRVKKVTATRGKLLRAEPVAGIAEQNRLHIIGSLPELEDQMCTWTPGQPSPDRLDALVWAVTDLLIARPAPKPVVRFRT